MTDLKPCPICGANLSLDDVSFATDEGEPCMSEDIASFVIVACDCGYHFTARSDDLGFLLDDWVEKFVELANRRVKG